MEQHQIVISTRKMYVYGLLVFSSALTLAAGFLIQEQAHGAVWQLTLGHLLTEVGIAGFVGFILALTFERLSAEEFHELARKERDDVKRDVFHYVFGLAIPQEITAIIDKQILKTPLVRRNLRVDYILEAVEAPGVLTKYVRATRTLNYDVENLTDQPQGLPIVSSVDVAPIPELEGEAKFIYIKAEGCATPFEADETQLKAMQRETRIEKCVSLEDKVTVLPDRETSMTVITQSVKHYEGGELYLILNNHTCDLELNVTVPGREMDIVAAATTENELEKTRGHKPQFGFYSWKVKRPLLAYQGVNVRWFPVAAPVASAAGAPAPAVLAAGNGSAAPAPKDAQ